MKVKRIKGFTIQEIMIVMVITSLIATMVFSIIQYSYRFLNSVVKTGNAQSEINHLQQVLSVDFLRADEINFDNMLVCKFYLESATYQFNPNCIIRRSLNSVDSFKIAYTLPTVGYCNDKLVNSFELKCLNNEVEFRVSAIKKYPFKMNLEKK